MVVVADDQQVEVARGAGDRCDLLWVGSKTAWPGTGNQSEPQPAWSFQ